MWRLLLKLALLAGVSYAWNGCSAVAFCNKFRNQVLDASAQFQAQLTDLTASNNIVTIPLSNTNGDKLNLQLSLLDNNKARIKILEENSQRYELTDVLLSEPTVVGYDANTAASAVTFTPSDGQSYKIVVNQGPPFTIQFYKGDDLEITFDASRMVLENTADSAAFHFDVYFDGSTSGLYGLHHHCHEIHLRETADGSSDPFRLRNSDAAGFQPGSTNGLYGAVPAVFGHSAARTAGVLLQNAAEQWVDINYANTQRPSAHYMAAGGALDLFILLGPTPMDTVKQMIDLTGRAHLPQYWTLGYHQCRYSYQSQDEVKSVIANMDQANFPMDAIWLDIDYTDQKKYFTWNPDNFADPKGMQEYIAGTNRKLVTIIDPHIKVDDTYYVYNGAKGKLFVKSDDGTSDYQGNCWPGTSSWIDFLNPEARDYWVSLYAYDAFNGSTPTLAGTWNDMNEPAIFGGDEASLPGTAIHTGPDGNKVLHRDVHNAYGFLQSKASHEALYQRDGGKVRPFVLTRSHFAGSQRYAAHWTGDNRAEYPYLPVTYSECMLANILGHVFCGADIGGFEGNPNDDLIQRWYQAGVWIPFYRGHANSNTNHREPYVFDESIQAVIRKAMRVRYKHIPMFYTLFYIHARDGDPIIRPLFFEYPGLFDYDHQILVGTDIMGTPVMQEYSSTVDVLFPGDSSLRWYRVDLDTVTVHNGGATETVDAPTDTSPYFYRGGSIITTKNAEEKSTLDMQDQPFTLYVNLDANSYAEGKFYDDDHVSFDYQNGDFFYLSLTSNGEYIDISVVDGDRDIDFTIEAIVVHTASKKDPKTVIKTVYNTTIDGTALKDINMGHHIKSSKGPKKFTLHLA